MKKIRRVYILHQGNSAIEIETISSLKKIVDKKEKELKLPSYSKLSKVIADAKKSDGILSFKNKDGEEYVIQVKEVE